MADRQKLIETIQSGLDEITEIYRNEQRENGSKKELEEADEKAREYIDRIETMEDREKIFQHIKSFAEAQKEALTVINNRLDVYESEGREEKAEKEHDRRHALVGTVGGIIQLSGRIADTNEDYGEEILNEKNEVKSFVQ
ncbi:MAG: hypothetical protein ABEJ95_05800 [Candidatus Nanohalobium sp.]